MGTVHCASRLAGHQVMKWQKSQQFHCSGWFGFEIWAVLLLKNAHQPNQPSQPPKPELIRKVVGSIPYEKGINQQPAIFNQPAKGPHFANPAGHGVSGETKLRRPWHFRGRTSCPVKPWCHHRPRMFGHSVGGWLPRV